MTTAAVALSSISLLKIHLDDWGQEVEVVLVEVLKLVLPRT